MTDPEVVVRLLAAIDEREREYHRCAEELREAARAKARLPHTEFLRATVSDGLRLCQSHRDIVAMFPVSEPHMDTHGLFYGFQARDCGEHRTVGPHRAWCFDCSEWCYPDGPCQRCHGVDEVIKVLARGYGIEDGESGRG